MLAYHVLGELMLHRVDHREHVAPRGRDVLGVDAQHLAGGGLERPLRGLDPSGSSMRTL